MAARRSFNEYEKRRAVSGSPVFVYQYLLLPVAFSRIRDMIE